MMFSTQFELLSLPFELTTNDKKFFNEFIELNSALVSLPNGVPPLIKYSVIKHSKYSCIRENGKLRLRTTYKWPLYIFVMMCVRDSIYMNTRGYLFLHSGAVVKDGKAILLVGPSRSGKSTLTLGLLSYGYNYLTDEVAVVDLSELKAMPFQRPIFMHGWVSSVSPEVRKDFKSRRFKEGLGRTVYPWQYVFPQKGGALPKDSRFEVAYIIFPGYNETQESSRLIPISKAEATFNLIQSGWNITGLRDWGLKACSELVKRAEGCYRLEMGDLREACELVEGLGGRVPTLTETKVLRNLWKCRLLM